MAEFLLCPDCAGEKFDQAGWPCEGCGGSGEVPDNRQWSEHDRAVFALMKQGMTKHHAVMYLHNKER